VPQRPTEPPKLDATEHRRLGAGLYNFTWTLMEKPDRTADETDLMIESAHASAFHWMQIGTLNNRARGHWLCSRAYAVAGRAEPSLWHAQRCLALVEAGGGDFEDWERGSALEAVSRAYAVGGDREEAVHYRDMAAAELTKIKEDGDREVLEKDLASIPL
jgi:hypothetical protein